MNKSIYLAGPIGRLSYDDATEWRDYVADRLRNLVTCWDPMRHKSFLEGKVMADKANVYTHPLATSRGIMTRDYYDVKSCDVLFVNLLPCEKSGVTMGTIMEIAWAYMLQKPVIVVANEEDPHVVHPMLHEAISYRVDTLEEGVDLVKTILTTSL